jgi:hypothetical protein
MNRGRDLWDEGSSQPSTRREVVAALAHHPDKANILRLLVSDLQSTLYWPRPEAEGFVLETVGVTLDFLDEEEWPFVGRVIENVQQRMHVEFIDTTWPTCPDHGRHPLWLSREPPWRWTCTATSLSIPLGQLKGSKMWFGRRVGVLLTRLEPREREIARGTMQELGHLGPKRPSIGAAGSAGDVILVTDHRVLWVSWNPRWVTSLPFSFITSLTELTQAHRYALILQHEGITRSQWVPRHRFLWWSWGDAEAVRTRNRSVLAFSHQHTKAAQAIRAKLESMAVPRGERIALPRGEATANQVPYTSRRWRRRFWRRPSL